MHHTLTGQTHRAWHAVIEQTDSIPAMAFVVWYTPYDACWHCMGVISRQTSHGLISIPLKGVSELGYMFTEHKEVFS